LLAEDQNGIDIALPGPEILRQAAADNRDALQVVFCFQSFCFYLLGFWNKYEQRLFYNISTAETTSKLNWQKRCQVDSLKNRIISPEKRFLIVFEDFYRPENLAHILHINIHEVCG